MSYRSEGGVICYVGRSIVGWKDLSHQYISHHLPLYLLTHLKAQKRSRPTKIRITESPFPTHTQTLTSNKTVKEDRCADEFFSHYGTCKTSHPFQVSHLQTPSTHSFIHPFVRFGSCMLHRIPITPWNGEYAECRAERGRAKKPTIQCPIR